MKDIIKVLCAHLFIVAIVEVNGACDHGELLACKDANDGPIVCNKLTGYQAVILNKNCKGKGHYRLCYCHNMYAYNSEKGNCVLLKKNKQHHVVCDN